MIHLIHGADNVSSRNFLHRLKSTSQNYQVLDFRQIAKAEISQKLNSQQLFSVELIVVDWFEEKFLPSLPRQAGKLIIWSAKTISDTSWADKVTNFPLRSVSIFRLADAFGLRQAKLSQQLLEKTLVEEKPEAIISVLARQLKLISFSFSGDLLSASKSAFVREKIADQAKYWSERSVKRGFRALLEADLAIKSGLDPRVVISLAIAKTIP